MAIQSKGPKTSQPAKKTNNQDISLRHPIKTWKNADQAVNDRKQEIIDGKRPINNDQYDQGKLKALVIAVVALGALYLLLYLISSF
ncbi:hypothetical protein [Limosilactobacillus fermentum]|uniref:hypothetical protein n=1 Tax=Limosilactobacillus fermentum TaxID=1613 RepID=UPI000C1E6CB9|nr:hypothetical protein [Limosilactobacillus fermentum]PJF06426.1 hypothetical protein CUJ85_07140 [Limosilactobacillus fermentum]